MGIIFRGTQINISRRVAVKILKPTLSKDSDLVRRFAHETEVLANISHPNIVGLIDSGRDASGLNYMVMEYLPGRTFRAVLREATLTLPEILEVFAQTCEALLEAHAHEVIHRDLKFDNIMIRRFRDGRLHISILDFGVAKQLTHDESVTRSGEVPGTPGIIAPELVDQGAPSPQSDLYSIGVLMFTALTGQTPFKGRNDLELMRAHKFEDVPNLRQIAGDRLPEEVIELIYELMQKSPERRPSDAGQVRRRLEVIASSLRKRHPDAPRYVPPHSGGLKRLNPSPSTSATMERAERFVEQHDVADPDETPAPETRTRDPIIAPTSVVAILIAVLTALVLVLIYLIYQTFFLPEA